MTRAVRPSVWLDVVTYLDGAECQTDQAMKFVVIEGTEAMST
jgi:hypothetical protein